jgi:hypothetical protein
MSDISIPPEKLDPRAKREFWDNHIQAWQQSGLTQIDYCRQNNLKNHQWCYWRRKILKPSDTDVTFVPLSFSPSKISRPHISVFTPNGFRIEFEHGVDIPKLRQLLTTVRGL